TVSGYRVYEGSTVRSTVTGTSATASGLAAGSTHAYTVTAFNSAGESAHSAAVSATTGSGNPGAPGTPGNVHLTGSTSSSISLAFMLAGNGCTPMWDSQRPLAGGVDQQNINAIRSAGGDVVVSFGGWQGNKLGPNCSSASALAGAYQQVINAYQLKAIDIDIE